MRVRSRRHGSPPMRTLLERIAHALDERMAGLFKTDLEGGQHLPGSA
jgi:hypothetical protein